MTELDGIAAEPQIEKKHQKVGQTDAEPIHHQCGAAAQSERTDGAEAQESAFGEKEKHEKCCPENRKSAKCKE